MFNSIAKTWDLIREVFKDVQNRIIIAAKSVYVDFSRYRKSKTVPNRVSVVPSAIFRWLSRFQRGKKGALSVGIWERK